MKHFCSFSILKCNDSPAKKQQHISVNTKAIVEQSQLDTNIHMYHINQSYDYLCIS